MSEDWSVLTRPAPPPDEVMRFGDLDDQVIDFWHGDDGAADRPLVVIVHGVFWRPAYDRVHVRPMANALRDAGWDVASIEYRRQPGDPDAMVTDVAAALAMVDRALVTIGQSAGGHLVRWAAAKAPEQVAGTIALAPVGDLVLGHELALETDAVAAFLGANPKRAPTSTLRDFHRQRHRS